MKKGTLLMGALALILGMTACNTKQTNTGDDTQTASTASTTPEKSYAGLYSGVIPCADCSGIQTEIELQDNMKYTKKTIYLGKENTFEEQGTYRCVDDNCTKIVLENDTASTTYEVGDGFLLMLDTNGEKITGDLADNYILGKVDMALVDKHWKLIELSGNAVTIAENAKEPFITLNKIGNRVNGNAGCNSFFGTYQLKGLNRIHFSQMGATQMMCMNMEIETQMFQVFENADNYAIKGDTLSLNKARMAPLARFAAVDSENK